MATIRLTDNFNLVIAFLSKWIGDVEKIMRAAGGSGL